MTNRNQKNAARAYMAAHGVNYTTALRAVLAGGTSASPYIPYGHPDYRHPDTVWERVYDLKFAINTLHGKWQERAYLDYDALKSGEIHEQARRIPSFLDNLAARLPVDTAALLHRPTMEQHLNDVLTQGFEDYWDEVTSDDGYPEAATLDIAAGVIEWLKASAARPDHDSHPTTYLNSHQTRAVLHALTDTTLDTLDTVDTTHVGYRYDITRAIADPDERTVRLLADIVGYPRRDLALLLAPTNQ